MWTGPGKYTAGVVLSPEGGAMVVVEKKPRKVTGPLPSWAEDESFEWEDVGVVTWTERFAGSMSAMLDKIAARLKSAELVDDCTTYLDLTAMGLPLHRLLCDREAYTTPMEIGASDEKVDERKVQLVPLRVLQVRATLFLETSRLQVLSAVPDGPLLLRSLENLEALPESGPVRDVALAGAIGLWAAHRHATRGPWASRREPKAGTKEFQFLEALEFERRAIETAQELEECDWLDTL